MKLNAEVTVPQPSFESLFFSATPFLCIACECLVSTQNEQSREVQDRGEYPREDTEMHNNDKKEKQMLEYLPDAVDQLLRETLHLRRPAS